MPKEVEITITKKFYTAETAFRYARRGLISYGELNDMINQLESIRCAYPRDTAIHSLLYDYYEKGRYILSYRGTDYERETLYFDEESAAIEYFNQSGQNSAMLVDSEVSELSKVLQKQEWRKPE